MNRNRLENRGKRKEITMKVLGLSFGISLNQLVHKKPPVFKHFIKLLYNFGSNL